MSALRAFIRFWAGFLIGDDWMFAAAVAVGLGASWALGRVGDPAWWPLPVLVVLVVLLSLRRAIARGG